jgi:hypothetical protein
MTPLETIKAGILTNNMRLVAEGYNRVSSDVVDISDIPSTRIPPTQRRQVPQERIDDDYRHPEDDFVSTAKTDLGNPSRVEPFVPRKRINMFADEGERPPEYSEADRLADQRAKKAKPTPRREAYTPVTVTCISCGKRYNVNPVLVNQGTYNCDKCCTRRR